MTSHAFARLAAGLSVQLGQLASGARPESGVADLVFQASAHAGAAEQWCAARGQAPAALPVRSRRAYQWLRFLSGKENVLAAVEALALAGQVLAAAPWPRQCA
jgi:hypothetical protein